MARPEREVVGNWEGRRQDLERFWPGFVSFVVENQALVEELRGDVVAWSKGKPIALWPEYVEQATEGFVLFVYGAELARSLCPALARKIPVPAVKHEKSITSFAQASLLKRGTGETLQTSLVANYGHLAWPGATASEHTMGWWWDLRQSVSKHFTDRVVVDIVVAGVEEYAHEAFVRVKGGQRLKESIWEHRRLRSGYNFWDRINMEGVIYYLDEMERRALTWQLQALEAYFPHWTRPTRRFVSKVKKERLRTRGMGKDV